MIDETNDKCGIAGAYFFKKNSEYNVMPYLYRMLLHLQHRGQLSAGVSTYNHQRGRLIKTYKELGTVNEAFKTNNDENTKDIFRKYAGDRGIAHVRYATFGLPKKSYAHPFERQHGEKHKWFAFCFNGNIANFKELKDELIEKKHYHMIFNNDTEIIMHYLAQEITRIDKENQAPDLKLIFSNLAKKFDGAYSLAFIDALGRLVAVRDPLGLRPLCYSVDEEKVLFASEDIALKNVGCKNIQTLPAGHILIADKDEVRVEQYTDISRKAHCMFEYIYFANVASSIEGRGVYGTRFELGKYMAKLETQTVTREEYVVISVPDSSKPFGEGYAYTIGLPHKEGLLRNRFVGRTFIESTGRTEKIKNKFSIIKEVVQGKKIILLDDSIIRGNTTRELVDYLKKEGEAKEIHIRISCPAVVSPCFYGIDMSTVNELIAASVMTPGKDITPEESEKIAKLIGADSLIFQPLKNIPKAIGTPKEELCMACLNAEYPTPQGKKLYHIALKNEKLGVVGRTYE